MVGFGNRSKFRRCGPNKKKFATDALNNYAGLTLHSKQFPSVTQCIATSIPHEQAQAIYFEHIGYFR